MRPALRLPRRLAVLVTVGVLAACSSPATQPLPRSTSSDLDSGTSAPTTPVTPFATGTRSATATSTTEPVSNAPFSALERQYGARVGVVVLQTGTDIGNAPLIDYHGGDRFAYAALARVLTSGLVLLGESDAELDTVIPYYGSDIIGYAPVTAKHVGTGMTLRDLVTAAVRDHDTTAAVLLSVKLGGPGAVQQQLRDLGDDVTQVSRNEPQSLDATSGDPRDTSSPLALATDLRGITTSSLLRDERRSSLVQLLTSGATATTTTDPMFEPSRHLPPASTPMRQGLPSSWQVSGYFSRTSAGSLESLALVTVPGRAPVAVAILTESPSAASSTSTAPPGDEGLSGSPTSTPTTTGAAGATATPNDQLVTEVARIVARTLG